MKDEPLIKIFAVRIESGQEENGAWKLFKDEGEGNLTLSV